MRALAVLVVAAAAAVACTGTTGGRVVTFPAAAAGAFDGPATFPTRAGYAVTLDRARLHVGAVYLNQTVPIANAQETSCVLPGTYVAEVTSGADVDLLSTRAQPFPASGEGIEGDAVTAEVWLTGGDVNATDDPTIVLDVSGTATRTSDGQAFPFDGAISIGKNRAPSGGDPSQPGASPICKQRIVSPIPAAARVQPGGALLLRVDARPLFDGVDFATLSRAAGAGGRYLFDDDASTEAGAALYTALHAREGVYRVEWTTPEAAR